MSADGVTSVVLAGVGGQGILLASTIVAQAAMSAGYRVKTNEVHGMAQRGGSVIAQIRYGPEVFSPLVAEGTARVLGALEQMEALRYAPYLAPDGWAVISTQRIVPLAVSSGEATYPDPITPFFDKLFQHFCQVEALKLAQHAGSVKAANLVVLGALAGHLDLPAGAWREAIELAVSPQHREANLKAFEAGLIVTGRGGSGNYNGRRDRLPAGDKEHERL